MPADKLSPEKTCVPSGVLLATLRCLQWVRRRINRFAWRASTFANWFDCHVVFRLECKVEDRKRANIPAQRAASDTLPPVVGNEGERK